MTKKQTFLFIFVAALIIGAAFYLLQSRPVTEKTVILEVHPEKVSEKPISNEPEKVPSAPEEIKETFQEELADVMNQLPTSKDLQNLDEEEVHHTPDIVIEGGMMVGNLIEKAEQDPKRREETLGFLKACAENPDVLPQIRAVCWNKTLAQIPEWKIFLPISDAKVPEDIQNLASKLP
jgi:hypothetical protein